MKAFEVAKLCEGFKPDVRLSREEALKKVEEVKSLLVERGIDPKLIEVGGSIRRGKPTIGDIDIAIFDDKKVNKAFYQSLVEAWKEQGKEVNVRVLGDSQASVTVDNALFEFKKAPPEAYGSMMLHITGSGDYNMGLRAWVKARGYKLSQFGLYNAETGERYPSETEEAIYKQLGLPYDAPKDRIQFRPPGSRWQAIPPAPKADEIPANVPAEVREKLKDFKLPGEDKQGIKIPKDFLTNKRSRQRYYIDLSRWKKAHPGEAAEQFTIPDEFKLDRYLEGGKSENLGGEMMGFGDAPRGGADGMNPLREDALVKLSELLYAMEDFTDPPDVAEGKEEVREVSAIEAWDAAKNGDDGHSTGVFVYDPGSGQFEVEVGFGKYSHEQLLAKFRRVRILDQLIRGYWVPSTKTLILYQNYTPTGRAINMAGQPAAGVIYRLDVEPDQVLIVGVGEGDVSPGSYSGE